MSARKRGEIELLPTPVAGDAERQGCKRYMGGNLTLWGAICSLYEDADQDGESAQLELPVTR